MLKLWWGLRQVLCGTVRVTCTCCILCTFIGAGPSSRKKLKFEDCVVYERPPDKYTAEQIIKILVDPDESKICCVKPTSVTESATYVVDIRNLQNTEDIKKDEFGIWKYSGSYPQMFKVYTEEDGSKSVEKCCKGASGSNVVYLRRLHCTHPSNSALFVFSLVSKSNKAST